ncbi:DUF6777 domain-containing protein [Streptomyces sp. NPDC090798]|uniref:DUF6777 domain-containing protein n=1 Tax=Streptomyces sp. NPDC090798 TaxID=3365968 RepID=UPI00380C4A22
MSIRASMQRAGISAARRLALLLVSVLMVSGCSKSDQLFVVRAVAAGVSSVSPFFKEDRQLGTDIHLPEARPSGGVQASNSPGLYGGAPDGSDGSGSPAPAPEPSTAPGTGVWGGTTKPGTCAVAKLKKFLTDPKNSAKAQEWARVLHISTDQIPGYIDQLTPVVLRHDTLVTNHDYENGKAVSYAALLQAGIAILVDQQGLPAVKCSCGNPLLPFEGKVSKTDVRFKNGNKQWADYRQDRVVVVEPPPGAREIHKLQLVDVHDPGRGIARPVGSDGSQDKSFNTRQKHAVPPVTGLTFAEATRQLTDAGLGMSYVGDTLPADGAQVTASRPTEGSEVAWGTSVVLSARSDSPPESGGDPATPSDSGTGTGGTNGTNGAGSDPGTTPPTPSGGSSGPSSGAASSGSASPSDSGTGSGAPTDTVTSTPSKTATPTDTSGGTGGGTTSAPSHTSPTGSPTSSAPTTPSATAPTVPTTEPTSHEPTSTRPTVSSAPPTSEPVSSTPPAPVDPGTSDSAPDGSTGSAA